MHSSRHLCASKFVLIHDLGLYANRYLSRQWVLINAPEQVYLHAHVCERSLCCIYHLLLGQH